ncbi:SGNH/GDSL hydrolase family protein [Sesbania bispinosa]|nr:SGNH/GDSL hydrolase family protein [Sesbania bispinosa]
MARTSDSVWDVAVTWEVLRRLLEARQRLSAVVNNSDSRAGAWRGWRQRCGEACSADLGSRKRLENHVLARRSLQVTAAMRMLVVGGNRSLLVLADLQAAWRLYRGCRELRDSG